MQNQATERSSSPETAVAEWVARVAAGSAVVIFSKSTCSMCHAVKIFLYGMGVNPRVYEVDEDPRSEEIERALSSSTGIVVPVVFIGGKLVGSMDRVISFHINGTLVPLLKNAGALWL